MRQLGVKMQRVERISSQQTVNQRGIWDGAAGLWGAWAGDIETPLWHFKSHSYIRFGDTTTTLAAELGTD